MTTRIKTGILYFFMAVVLIAALITIRPAASPSSPPANTPAKRAASSIIIPETKPSPSLFELKLTENILYFTFYDDNGSPIEQKTIDYINIYSLYPEQLNSLKKGISFSSQESAAEFIQDLGS